MDGPSKVSELTVPRHAAALNSLSLTGLVIPKLPLGAGVTALSKKWEEFGVDKKWTESPYAKKIEKATRRKGLSDFERFKVMRLRKQVRGSDNFRGTVSLLAYTREYGDNTEEQRLIEHPGPLRDSQGSCYCQGINGDMMLHTLMHHGSTCTAAYAFHSEQDGLTCTTWANGGRMVEEKGYLQAFDSDSSMALSGFLNVVT